MAGLVDKIVTGGNIHEKDENIVDIATPATATAEDCANKLNELMAILRENGVIKTNA